MDPKPESVDSALRGAADELVLTPPDPAKVKTAARSRKTATDAKYLEAAKRIGNYWKEQTNTKLRSPKVAEDIIKRLVRHLRDGFTEADLKKCVDVALRIDWYVERKYFKRPEVIWRDASRIQSLCEGREESHEVQDDAEREARNQRILAGLKKLRANRR